MSRLIDKLIRLRQGESQPMGFLPVRPAVEKVKMQLIALLKAENAEKLAAGSISADAIIIEAASIENIETAGKVNKDREGAIIGGWLKSSSPDVMKKMADTGLDFWVYPASVHFNLAPKGKIGGILEADMALSDVLLRTVNELPVDAVLAAGKGPDVMITLTRLMQIQRLVYMVNKPLMAVVPENVTEEELQTLLDLGVSGVVVEVTDEKSDKKLSEIKQSIEKLNPSTFRKKARISPLLPRIQAGTPPSVPDEGEEEDE